MTSGEFSGGSEPVLGGEVDVSKITSMDFPVYVDLPDGLRMIAYHPNATSEQEVIDRVTAEYEAAGPIVTLAAETARKLGATTKQLLEMAITRLDNSQED